MKATTEAVTKRLGESGGKVISDGWLLMNLAVTAPDAAVAARLHREFDAWLKLPADLRLPAPWRLPQRVMADEERVALLRAAETFHRIEDAKQAALMTPAAQREMQKSMIFWRLGRYGNPTDRLRELQASRERREREAFAQVQASGDPALDPGILAHEARRPHRTGGGESMKAYTAWRKELRWLLTHEAPVDAPAPAPEPDATDEDDEETLVGVEIAGVYGRSAVVGRDVILSGLSFAEPGRDLPAIVRWFSTQGCTALRFGVQTRAEVEE
jgi:hypothetical protein